MTDAITLDENTRLLAAIAYGEASGANDPDEIGGIAFAVANRCRAWGKTVTEIKAADPSYAFAWAGKNERFNKFMRTPDSEIELNPGMRLAADLARKALGNEGPDPSNGAYWWDGLDFKTNYANHRKVNDGFQWGDASHNIFNVPEHKVPGVVYWRAKDKKTGKIVNTKERGRYDSVWISTAAHGSTVFWTHNPDYVKATGCLPYK